MAKADKKPAKKGLSKIDDLSFNTENGAARFLTTNQGLKINDNNNSLKAGERGPTLLEDFILREKTTHFDHERIPERIVHARGSGAHGIFKVYKPLDRYTKAAFLNDTTSETPVFVRFSTVAGSRGSSDLARDVRGFAVKFYTSEGNYDLVGNNMLGLLMQVDKNLVAKVAGGLGLPLPKAPEKPMNHGVSADANENDTEPVKVKSEVDKSQALSMEGTIKNNIKTRKVAFLVANGVKDESLNKMRKALVDNGATVKLISVKQGTISTEGGKQIPVDGSFLTDASVLYDAVYIPDGKKSIAALLNEPDSIHFVNEAYKHCKPIATGADGIALLKEIFVKDIGLKNLNMEEAGVITDGHADKFIGCIANHRFWNREEFRKVPA